MENLENVGPVIRRLREEKGWNQTELAAYSHTALATVSHIETGRRRPSARSLARIAAALDVDVADLFPKGDTLRLPLEVEEGFNEDYEEYLKGLTLEGLQRLGSDLLAEHRQAMAEKNHQEAADIYARRILVGKEIERRDPPLANIKLRRGQPAEIIFYRDPTDEELKELEEQYPGYSIAGSPISTQ